MYVHVDSCFDIVLAAPHVWYLPTKHSTASRANSEQNSSMGVLCCVLLFLQEEEEVESV